MKKIPGNLLLFVVLLFSCNSSPDKQKKELVQNDYDIIRLNHISYLYKTVQEYASVKGTLPFAEESDSVPVVVVFETPEQAQRHNGNYPIIVHLETRFPEADSVEKPQRVVIKKGDELYRELKAVLNVEVASVTDPQKLPGKKPCLYIMTIYKNVFDVTAFLHNPLPFTRKLAQGNNKVSLTSATKSYPLVAIWTMKALCGKTVYKVFMNEPFNDEGLRKQLLPDRSQKNDISEE